MQVGEIKPANAAGRADGAARMLHYLTCITNVYGESVGPMTFEPPPVIGRFDEPEKPVGCPDQELFVNPPMAGVYTYYCQPTFAHLKATGLCHCGKRKRQHQEKANAVPLTDFELIPELEGFTPGIADALRWVLTEPDVEVLVAMAPALFEAIVRPRSQLRQPGGFKLRDPKHDPVMQMRNLGLTLNLIAAGSYTLLMVGGVVGMGAAIGGGAAVAGTGAASGVTLTVIQGGGATAGGAAAGGGAAAAAAMVLATLVARDASAGQGPLRTGATVLVAFAAPAGSAAPYTLVKKLGAEYVVVGRARGQGS